MRIAITSGYFDPIHLGHIELLELSRAQGDVLWVIVNNDAQAAIKKGKAFFCKGGDRNAGNIPEMEVLRRHGARLLEGLVANIDSSSSIIARAKGR